MADKKSAFTDQELRREILAQILWDRQFLRRCGDFLTPEDFEGGELNGSASVLAGIGLDFWRRYRTPVSGSLGLELSAWSDSAGLGPARRKEMASIVRDLKSFYAPDRSPAVADAVRAFQRRMQRLRAIRDLAALEQAGELTDERWMQVTQELLAGRDSGRVTDWLRGAGDRTARRLRNRGVRVPWTMIEPLDSLVQPVGRGHLGVWLAPLKRGKSLAFVWQALAYVWQGYSVLFLTLEDPLEDVEDRLDACAANVEISLLAQEGPQIERSVRRVSDMVRARLRVYDGTDGSVSVETIAGIWERERAAGFEADVVLVDYDDEIRPSEKRRDRRHEFADIYRGLRQFAARTDTIVWTAAQATRDSMTRELVRGQDVAEDISKIRKATMVIGIGLCNEWNGDAPNQSGDAKTLFVAAHKFDRQGISCRIVSDPRRGVFYDHEATQEHLRRDDDIGDEEV